MIDSTERNYNDDKQKRMGRGWERVWGGWVSGKDHFWKLNEDTQKKEDGKGVEWRVPACLV